MQILASGKNSSNKYDLKAIDPNKVLPRVDVRQLAENFQRLLEETQGFSFSGNEGSPEAIVSNLSTISVDNLSSFSDSFAKTIQTYVANASRLDVDAGSSANAIILNKPKIPQNELDPNAVNHNKFASLPFKYKDDLRFTFRAKDDNTAATTISIPDLPGLVGSVELVNEQESALVGGEIKANQYYTVVAKNISATNKFILLEYKGAKATQTLSGVAILPKQITIENGADTDHDIDFTAGNFNFDDGTGQASVSALTKQIDANWVAGTNAGGLDTGAVAIDTTYHCFAIYNPTTKVSDFLFSTSLSSPTFPSGFTKKRKIASFITDGSANIRPGSYIFNPDGSYRFYYSTVISDFNGNTPTVLTDLALSIPPNSISIIRLHFISQDAAVSSLVLKDKVSGQEFTAVESRDINAINNNSEIPSNVHLEIQVDSSSNIQHKGSAVSDVSILDIRGFIDNNL